MRNPRSNKTTAGFSIIELLIAIIIIGILVAVIIPALVLRTRDARIAAAESDLEHLQAAEERAAITSRYLYRFYVLDDLVGGDGTFRPLDLNDVDGVRDEDLNTLMAYPTRIFIDVKTGLFVSDYASLFARMSRNETAFGWGGPYINFHQLRDIDRNDLPEDPWGEEYLLFTPEGVVDMSAGVVLRETSFYASDVGSSVPLLGPFFDRYTVLSMGPNRAPGDGTSSARFGTDDDLMRQFH
ncbi:hypothetical protein AMJ85_03565 [candidate division BRC1 bacterium SM23_51]|nr:MAG: hypothetical protein AMJ85_03565 [candidate division BRC1 bacterium SM23_51]